jgi:hypothetical protein
MRIASLCLASLFTIGCAASEDGSFELEPTPAAGPELKVDGGDAADRDCRLVLRTLQQPFGLPSNAANGVNWVVYHGMIDVADDADGIPAALFASNSTNGWWRVVATHVGDGEPGYQRYRFILDRNTVPMGDSTAWRHMRINVIPYLERADGRIFDHNRYRGDFENYVITKDESRYGDDLAVCH